MKGRIILALIVISYLTISCDKIEGPYSENGGNGNPDTSSGYYRKILVEDFTGHTCGNCPRAAETLKQLHDLYGDKVVSFAVHVGFFAEPQPSGYYTADYRTVVGNEIDQYFGNSTAGLPNGLVNRISFDSNPIVQHTDWASKVSSMVSTAPDAWIELMPEFNASSRELSVSSTTRILNEISDSLHITYYLTEDSILSAQKDYSLSPSTIQNYYHRHVLRGSMNGTWGTALSSGQQFAAGQQFTHSASFTLPANWNAQKVHIVAVLSKAGSKEVIQAEEAHIE